MSRYTELAKQKTEGSPVLAGREKIETDAVIALYPDGITITQFDFLNGKNGKYVVCTFAEDASKFFNGGKILTDIFESFVDHFKTPENTYAEALELCQNDFNGEFLKVKLSRGRTKDGNRITKVEVLD